MDYEPSLKRIKLEKDVDLEEEDPEQVEVPLTSEMNIKLEQPTEEDIVGGEQVPIEYVGEEVNEYVNEDPHEYVTENPNEYVNEDSSSEFVTEEANEYVIVQEFGVAEDEVS